MLEPLWKPLWDAFVKYSFTEYRPVTWDERRAQIDSWILFSNYYVLLAIIVGYLLLIYDILPKFMENRKPFDITLFTRLYNLFQIAACSTFSIGFVLKGYSWSNLWKCYGQDEDNGVLTSTDVDFYSYIFTILRLIEFIETVFFIVRKRNDQVSFLHVYHHIAVVVNLWLFVKFNGGIMGIYIGIFNATVHIIMYSYYLLSSFKSLANISRRIKPYLTMVQIVQLVALVGQCISALQPGCDNNRPLYVFQMINIVVILMLFIQFYYKSYRKMSKKTK